MIHFAPDEQAGRVQLSLARPALLAAALLAILALLLPMSLLERNRSLEADLERSHQELEAAASRERDLEDSLVRQHRQLQTAEQELETMEHQIAAIELQLDGVDFLASQLRESLGLEPGTGTWAPEAEAGRGGPGAQAPGPERLAQSHRRLLTGYFELQALQQRVTREQSQSDAAEGAAEAPTYSSPVNWPARGEVTSSFGWRVFRGRPNYHTGIDIGLPYGSAVQVTGDGVVIGSGWQPSYGWSVLIDHGLGYSSLYAHLSQTLVKVGQRVSLGDALGLSGSSGNSTGPHLHYEVWKDGMLLDPRPLMDGRAE
jgi:murein DD-endopeptidase MepM/ murein hydrolase activator NlpD